jgi:hypothetical protein
MKKNMGVADRVIRLLIAALIIVLFFANYIWGTFAIILLIIAGVLLVTSFVSICPLYSLLGIRTCPNKE